MTTRTTNRRVAIGLLAAMALTVGYLGLRALARPAAPHPWFAPRPGEHRPLVFAHQGGAWLRPPNTLAAFRHAVELGADVIDTDLRMTRDGVLVLAHDARVDATTDGTGAIDDLDLAQLQQLDAGYRFSVDAGTSTPWRGKGLQIPTLDEALAAFPDRRFGIEIKGGEPHAMARGLCAALRRRGMQRQTLASSFSQDHIDALRETCPEVATSASTSEARNFFLLNAFGLTALISPAYQSLQVPQRFGALSLANAGFLASARERGVAVQFWTVNEEAEIRRLIALGVDGLNSDVPDRVIALLK